MKRVLFQFLAIIPLLLIICTYYNPVSVFAACGPNQCETAQGCFDIGKHCRPDAGDMAAIYECKSDHSMIPTGNTCLKDLCIETTLPNNTTDAACKTVTPTPIPTESGNGASCNNISLPDGGIATEPLEHGKTQCRGMFIINCQNGTPKLIDTCRSAENKQCKNTDASHAECQPGVATPTIDPSCSFTLPPAQQSIPKVGINCGVAKEHMTPETTPGANACCYSAVADKKFSSISCFVTLPGAEDFIKGIDTSINDYVNNKVPLGDGNIALLRKALKETPLCEPGSTTSARLISGNAAVDSKEFAGKVDIDGVTPLCQCEVINKKLSELCKNITKDGKADAEEQAACQKCMTSGTDGIWTAIGCINVGSENGFIQSLMRLGISLGGAFALLCNVYGAYLFQTSRGNPEGLKKAQDMITSCITGLLLIIFSVFILRLIGYNILRIPGFG